MYSLILTTQAFESYRPKSESQLYPLLSVRLWVSHLISLRYHFLTCEIMIIKPTLQLLKEWNSIIHAKDTAWDRAHGESTQMRAPVLSIINRTWWTSCKYWEWPECFSQKALYKEMLICWVCTTHCWKRQCSTGHLHFFTSCCVCQEGKTLTPFYLGHFSGICEQ